MKATYAKTFRSEYGRDGVSAANREVKFFIDNVLKKKEDLKADTYGFGGLSENRCAFVLKGQKDMPFEVKLHDFSVKASASALAYAQTSETVYRLANNATLTRATENNITVETAQAPDIDSSRLVKDVIHSSSAAFANGASSYIKVGQNKGNYNLVDGEYVEVGTNKGNYTKLTNGNYNTGGYNPIYSMISAKGKLGSVNYSDYNYLRFRFNVFVNDSHNGIILRLARYNSANSDVYSKDYAFGIGASDFSNYSPNNSMETYTSKSLETGKWNSVILELGVQAEDSTVNLYVNGESKSMTVGVVSGGTATFGVDNGVGYCGASANRCYIGLKSNFDEPLDMYLSDVLLTVENTAYNPANAGFPNFNGNSNEYTGYLGEGEAIAYNKKYATFKYDNVNVSGTDYVTVNSADYSGDTTNVNIDFVNPDGDKNAATVVVAYYKETENTPKLVMAKFINVNTENLFTNLSNNIDKPNAEFDYVKVFAIDGTNVKPLGTVTFGTGAVEVLPEE